LILTKPGEPQLPDKWYIGITATCEVCGAEGTIEATDRIRWRKYHHGKVATTSA